MNRKEEISNGVEIKEIIDKGVWESFLSQCKEKTFLDSWNWGEFQKKQGEKIWRLGIYDSEQRTMDKEQLIAVALVILVKARRGTFLFLPHGPVTESGFQSPRSSILKSLIDQLKIIVKQEKASFIRIAPIWEKSEKSIKIFKDLGFRNAPIHMHPELTWELDISSSEEDLLRGMRKTTRYLIKQAVNNDDIEVIKSQNINDLKEFDKIYQKTATRHHFVPFSLDYLEKQFSSFNPDNQIVIYLGKYQGKVVSSAMMVYWQNIGFYHHGASLPSKMPVSYLMQWEAIKEAKLRQCHKYNFWGIAPDNSKNHPWAGLSLFKRGFGGYRKDYVKTQDLPLSRSYYLTFAFELLRKKRRRL